VSDAQGAVVGTGVGATRHRLKLALVDLSSVFHPAWHVGLSKDQGFAHVATVARVRRAAGEATFTAIACDSASSFRKALSPAYKADRPAKSAALEAELKRVCATLAADGFMVARADGFEADDVIATFVAWARRYPDPPTVEILSSDKDLLALVGGPVRVRSVSSGMLFGVEEVRVKLGVPPAQVPDYLALVGDSSDGIEGVTGVGAKTAARLLTQFGSLDALLDRAGEVTPPGIGAAIVAARGNGTLALARQLIALRDDAPVDCRAVLAHRAGFG